MHDKQRKRPLKHSVRDYKKKLNRIIVHFQGILNAELREAVLPKCTFEQAPRKIRKPADQINPEQYQQPFASLIYPLSPKNPNVLFHRGVVKW